MIVIDSVQPKINNIDKALDEKLADPPNNIQAWDEILNLVEKRRKLVVDEQGRLMALSTIGHNQKREYSELFKWMLLMLFLFVVIVGGSVFGSYTLAQALTAYVLTSLILFSILAIMKLVLG